MTVHFWENFREADVAEPPAQALAGARGHPFMESFRDSQEIQGQDATSAGQSNSLIHREDTGVQRFSLHGS